MSELVKCKTCGKEVSKTAPTCPHCGEKAPGLHINIGKFMHQNIHSNYIIHWTGFDIDNEFDQAWAGNSASKTSEDVTEMYLERLKSILKHGLWMTENEKDIEFEKKYGVPFVSKTCFTELKLSEVRNHTANFGRLGIGFKNFFLFDRMGNPMIYYSPLHFNEGRNWLHPKIIKEKNDPNYSSSDFFQLF